MAIQVRRGNEVDFDPSKMLPGEWAVSLDTRYVRMCFAPGIVVRMATYEAFEADMSQIKDILVTSQNIEEVVKRLAEEVNENTDIVVENTSLSKQYMEQAKMYAENAEAVTNVKIASQTEAGLMRGGENYVDESGTLVLTKQTTDATLYNSYTGGLKIDRIAGAVEQNQYSGKNTVPYPHDVTYPYTNYGVTFDYDKETGFITANGTASSTIANYSVLNVQNRNDTAQPYKLPKGKYIATGCPSGGSNSTYRMIVGYTNASGGYSAYATDTGEGAELEVVDETRPTQIQIAIQNGYTANNLVFKPMIRRADIEDGTYEPYVGGIPSPNPDYPQEIKNVEVSEIKTEGKNRTTKEQISFVLRAIEVSANDDYTYEKGGKYYVADTIEKVDDVYKYVQKIEVISSYNGETIINAYMSTTGGLDIGAEVHYILAEPIITQISNEDAIALMSLKTFDTVTYTSTDSEVEPVIDVEYGTSKVGGYTLEALNTAQKNEIKYASLATLTNSLATALVAGSEE